MDGRGQPLAEGPDDDGPLPPPPAPILLGAPRRRPRRGIIRWRWLNRPKRPKAPFMIFANDRRRTVRRANPQMSIPEVSTVLGEEWRAMTAQERRPFKQRSKRDRNRYHRQMAEWRRARMNQDWWQPPPDEPV